MLLACCPQWQVSHWSSLHTYWLASSKTTLTPSTTHSVSIGSWWMYCSCTRSFFFNKLPVICKAGCIRSWWCVVFSLEPRHASAHGFPTVMYVTLHSRDKSVSYPCHSLCCLLIWEKPTIPSRKHRMHPDLVPALCCGFISCVSLGHALDSLNFLQARNTYFWGACVSPDYAVRVTWLSSWSPQELLNVHNLTTSSRYFAPWDFL